MMKNFGNRIISGMKNSARRFDNAIQRQISGAGEAIGINTGKKLANFSQF